MTAATLVELTPIAAEKVLALSAGDPERSFLRVYVAGQGCCRVQYGMAFTDSVLDDDELVESNGVQMAVDPGSKESVSGVKIDFVSTPQGEGFTVNNPASPAGGGCSCGH